MFVDSVSFPAAFLAGIFSFFSPCVLPLIPSYFSFIGGCSIEELTGDKTAVRTRILASTTLFVFGFSMVFILLGASASMLGNVLISYRQTVRIIGGLVIIVLGIHLLGLFRIPGLDIERRIHFQKRPVQLFGALLIGMAFAAGWSPCIGPLLGAILIMAGNQDTVGQGITLLSLYSLGMAVPFLVLSVFVNSIFGFLIKTKAVMKYLNRAAGIILILAGALLITDNLNLIAGYLQDIL